MKDFLRKIPFVRLTYRSLRMIIGALLFCRDYFRFIRMSGAVSRRFRIEYEPCLLDRTGTTDFDRHYIYHPAWAARILAATKPSEHVDISSSLHFCTLVSAFIPVRFYDYRPADLQLSNLVSEPADLMALPFGDGSIQSLSCMHVVEHVGLGRYGDPIDPDGDLKAIAELKRVLAPGGSLLFVVPVGRPRLIFNTHRIYSYEQVVECFAGLELREFAVIPEKGNPVCNATKEMADAQMYACGCFRFVKVSGEA